MTGDSCVSVWRASPTHWDDIDGSEWVIHLRDESRGGSRQESDLKTTKLGSSRVVQIHLEVRRILEQMPSSDTAVS
jgi:hypothetical protein